MTRLQKIFLISFITFVVITGSLLIYFKDSIENAAEQKSDVFVDVLAAKLVKSEWDSLKLMAAGTPFNIDSMNHYVFDTIKNDDYQRLGAIHQARDSIKIWYKR